MERLHHRIGLGTDLHETEDPSLQRPSEKTRFLQWLHGHNDRLGLWSAQIRVIPQLIGSRVYSGSSPIKWS